MLQETGLFVAEYLGTLGFDVIAHRVEEKINEKKLKNNLREFIAKQKQYNELCLIADEIDYQGLVEFIDQNLIDTVCIRLFHPDAKIRESARDEIMDAAFEACKADSPKAKRHVSKCIDTSLEIIRVFYRSEFSVKDFLFAEMITEAVNDAIDDSAQKVLSEIKDLREIIVTQKSSIGSFLSLDSAYDLAEAGDYDALEHAVKVMLDSISPTHILYPDYSFCYKNGKILSEPMTSRATRVYPPRIVMSGKIRFGDQYYNQDEDPSLYSYRHQIPMTIEVESAQKLLGIVEDPRQSEAKSLVNQSITVYPPQFPPAAPYSIKVGGETVYEYVLLRVQEITDEGKYIVGNRDQIKCPLEIGLCIDPQNLHLLDIELGFNNTNNHDLLKYTEFMKKLTEGMDIHIYDLTEAKDLYAGRLTFNQETPDFSSLEEDIDLISRVCDIEDFFHVELSVGDSMDAEEYQVVMLISELLRNREVSHEWKKINATGTLDQLLRTALMSAENDLFMLSCIISYHVKMFNAEFDYAVKRTYKSARIIDLAKVKQKAAILDDGDVIKIGFRPGDNNIAVDILNI